MNDLEKIASEIENCKKCGLWEIRKRTVPGEDPSNAKIVFLGQTPGRNENIQGKPFVGISGKLLNKLLESIKLKREKFFITGVVKCHTPKNRKPNKKEIKSCIFFTLKQLEVIKPKIVALLGDVTIKALRFKGKLSEIHGEKVEMDGKIYFFTFHPAASMRFPKIRKLVEEDFRKLVKLVEKI
ncbi:MAG: uracil-DNA glycosylase [Candidatus Aenigmatarchaeota archaeon]